MADSPANDVPNPFLLPPRSTPSTAPAAAPEPVPVAVSAPDAPPAQETDHYIEVPASVESATHRLARSAAEQLPVLRPEPEREPQPEPEPAPEPKPAPEPDLRPEPERHPGPDPTAHPQPPQPPWPARLVDEIADPLVEETVLSRLVAPVQRADDQVISWDLVLPDGSRLLVAGPIVLGRDPAAPPEHPDAELLPLHDPGKTVSKTHALVEPAPADGGVRVHDLFSTNGVAIDLAGIRTVVTPGASAVASGGSSIALGSFGIGIGVAKSASDPA